MATATGAQRRGDGRPRLSRPQVLTAALAVIDRDGVDGLTMRKLGLEAGVEAMSLYNHVADKGDVLDGVVALLWQEIEAGLPTSGTWQEYVRGLASAVRAVARAHPNAYPLLLTRGTLPPAGLEVSGRLLVWLRDAGFGALAEDATRAIGTYAVSYNLAELAWYGDRPATDGCLSADTAPADLAGVAGEGWRAMADCDEEAQFDFGLDLLVAGLEAKLADQEAPSA